MTICLSGVVSLIQVKALLPVRFPTPPALVGLLFRVPDSQCSRTQRGSRGAVQNGVNGLDTLVCLLSLGRRLLQALSPADISEERAVKFGCSGVHRRVIRPGAASLLEQIS